MSADGEIAYILKGFPRLSETFISNEIHLLESLGLRLRLYSVKSGDKDKVHDVVARIRAPLTYLPETTSLSNTSLWRWLKENWPNYSDSHRALLRRRPIAYLTTLLATLAMSVRYRESMLAEPRIVFIKEFLQAGAIAEQIAAAGTIRHLHGHFCHGATTITWLVSKLTGIPFSFTAHAKDIYQEDLNPGDLLPRKMRAARFVTTCTDANHQHLAARHPAPDTLHTVYHGLDTEYFSPLPQRASAEPPLLLSVGRFVEKKGFAYLVSACALLKQQDVRFRCVIVGEKGDQSARIAQMLHDLNLTDRVTLAGPLTHGELRNLYRAASVFALPCVITEDGDRDGIPNVLAEAMAMGIPIVSTPISGIPEIVDQGVEGLLVPDRDSEALAAAIGRLLRDTALAERLAAAARRKICDCFDSRKTTLQLKALFMQAMTARAPSERSSAVTA